MASSPILPNQTDVAILGTIKYGGLNPAVVRSITVGGGSATTGNVTFVPGSAFQLVQNGNSITFNNTAPGGGGVNGISANGGTPQTGTINLTNGPGFTVANTGGTFQFTNAGVTTFNGNTGAVTGVSSFNGQTGATTGVSTYNGATGAVTLGSGNGVSVNTSGNNTTITNTGVTSVGGTNGDISLTNTAPITLGQSGPAFTIGFTVTVNNFTVNMSESGGANTGTTTGRYMVLPGGLVGFSLQQFTFTFSATGFINGTGWPASLTSGTYAPVIYGIYLPSGGGKYLPSILRVAIGGSGNFEIQNGDNTGQTGAPGGFSAATVSFNSWSATYPL